MSSEDGLRTQNERMIELLECFAAAYNDHDVEGIMSCMTDSCTFISYFGPDVCGEKFSGRDAVRKRVAAGLADFPDAHWQILGHFVSGDRGVSEWIFRGHRNGEGEAIERQGVDVFTFKHGKIDVKNTYQKWRQST